MPNASIKKVMLVAGEQSGDILGAGLIRELKRKYPSCIFFGVGGPLMIAEGFRSLYPIDRLSVMGFIDPLRRLPELLSILGALKSEFKSNKPDIFVGIDSPDFNNKLEKVAKKNGVYSVHYVSPSVWAWRQGRIKGIKKTVDLMLTLFPFEAEFYQRHAVDVCFVGHPLADTLPIVPDKQQAMETLKLSSSDMFCALLPGSRRSEVLHLLPVMAAAAKHILKHKPDIRFLIPAANAARKKEIELFLTTTPIENLSVYDGQSHHVMTAADCVIMASGTTTLEAMLLKKPMVIVYKMSRISFWIFSRLVTISRVGLPNLLAGKDLVPELLQDDAEGKRIAEKALSFINDTQKIQRVCAEFEILHRSLRKNANRTAADAIAQGFAQYKTSKK